MKKTTIFFLVLSLSFGAMSVNSVYSQEEEKVSNCRMQIRSTQKEDLKSLFQSDIDNATLNLKDVRPFGDAKKDKLLDAVECGKWFLLQALISDAVNKETDSGNYEDARKMLDQAKDILIDLVRAQSVHDGVEYKDNKGEEYTLETIPTDVKVCAISRYGFASLTSLVRDCVKDYTKSGDFNYMGYALSLGYFYLRVEEADNNLDLVVQEVHNFNFDSANTIFKKIKPALGSIKAFDKPYEIPDDWKVVNGKNVGLLTPIDSDLVANNVKMIEDKLNEVESGFLSALHGQSRQEGSTCSFKVDCSFLEEIMHNFGRILVSADVIGKHDFVDSRDYSDWVNQLFQVAYYEGQDSVFSLVDDFLVKARGFMDEAKPGKDFETMVLGFENLVLKKKLKLSANTTASAESGGGAGIKVY